VGKSQKLRFVETRGLLTSPSLCLLFIFFPKIFLGALFPDRKHPSISDLEVMLGQERKVPENIFALFPLNKLAESKQDQGAKVPLANNNLP